MEFMNVSAYSQRKESIIKQLFSVEGWGKQFCYTNCVLYNVSLLILRNTEGFLKTILVKFQIRYCIQGLFVGVTSG